MATVRSASMTAVPGAQFTASTVTAVFPSESSTTKMLFALVRGAAGDPPSRVSYVTLEHSNCSCERLD